VEFLWVAWERCVGLGFVENMDDFSLQMVA